jgi:hypothetical protein
MSSPNLPECLNDARAKIERAKEHIADLDSRVRIFIASGAYKVGSYKNPNTGEVSDYAVVSVAETPAIFSVIAGEALQSLRSALDFLAYRLFLKVVETPGMQPMSTSRLAVTTPRNTNASALEKYKECGRTLLKQSTQPNRTREGRGTNFGSCTS